MKASHSDVGVLGPEFNRDSWFNEKFNLGLDFPNVRYIYSVFLLRDYVFSWC